MKKQRYMWNTYEDYENYVKKVIYSCTTLTQIENVNNWLWYIHAHPELHCDCEAQRQKIIHNFINN